MALYKIHDVKRSNFGTLFLLENFLWILEVGEHFLEVRAPKLEDFRGFLETSLHLLENQNRSGSPNTKRPSFPPTMRGNSAIFISNV